MPLPTEKSKVNTKIENTTTLIHGDPKIGKSTFCSQVDGAVFIATEPGLDMIECYQAKVASWREMLEVCKSLAEEKHGFKAAILDTVDMAWQLCTDDVCQKNGINYLGDMPHGKGWALASNEFQRVLMKLAHLPMGLFLVSHSVAKEVPTKVGTTVKIQPTLPDRARRIVQGLVDFILYFETEEEIGPDGKLRLRSVIRTKPTTRYEAGDMTGKLPETLPMDYNEFKKAFEAACASYSSAATTTKPVGGKKE